MLNSNKICRLTFVHNSNDIGIFSKGCISLAMNDGTSSPEDVSQDIWDKAW